MRFYDEYTLTQDLTSINWSYMKWAFSAPDSISFILEGGLNLFIPRIDIVFLFSYKRGVYEISNCEGARHISTKHFVFGIFFVLTFIHGNPRARIGPWVCFHVQHRKQAYVSQKPKNHPISKSICQSINVSIKKSDSKLINYSHSQLTDISTNQ